MVVWLARLSAAIHQIQSKPRNQTRPHTPRHHFPLDTAALQTWLWSIGFDCANEARPATNVNTKHRRSTLSHQEERCETMLHFGQASVKYSMYNRKIEGKRSTNLRKVHHKHGIRCVHRFKASTRAAGRSNVLNHSRKRQ